MADNNKLELVVEVDLNKANGSIRSIDTGLSSMEQAVGKTAKKRPRTREPNPRLAQRHPTANLSCPTRPYVRKSSANDSRFHEATAANFRR
jgi:hypothetical protein